FEEEVLDEGRKQKRTDKTQTPADHRKPRSSSENQSEDRSGQGAEGQANAKFARSTLRLMKDKRAQPRRGKNNGEQAEGGEKDRHRAFLIERRAQLIRERRDAIK